MIHVTIKVSTTEITAHTTAIAKLFAFSALTKIGSDNTDGDAKDVAETCIIPATSPVMPLETHSAIKGFLRGIVTP